MDDRALPMVNGRCCLVGMAMQECSRSASDAGRIMGDALLAQGIPLPFIWACHQCGDPHRGGSYLGAQVK